MKVMTGNLVGPWSWVTWQVHIGIRLTRKTLSKMSRVRERNGRVVVVVGGVHGDERQSRLCYNSNHLYRLCLLGFSDSI